jgi:hypothetical protein
MSNIVEDLLSPYTQDQSRRVALEAEAADEIQLLRTEVKRLLSPHAPPGYRLQPISEFDAYLNLLAENERLKKDVKDLEAVVDDLNYWLKYEEGRL